MGGKDGKSVWGSEVAAVDVRVDHRLVVWVTRQELLSGGRPSPSPMVFVAATGAPLTAVVPSLWPCLHAAWPRLGAVLRAAASAAEELADHDGTGSTSTKRSLLGHSNRGGRNCR
ncbi:hypothetical protein I4F81_005536 [Pyropia yezoensis]|uniref:Uncharacterized protein n=1 Tax=Pyropia yezoensis TaxID=2788 RepID=A0ACC3BYZ7_PYRYE|nr:hypothetical protein I4F81_005536 [Neopyropia yezoensis]